MRAGGGVEIVTLEAISIFRNLYPHAVGCILHAVGCNLHVVGCNLRVDSHHLFLVEGCNLSLLVEGCTLF